FDMMGETLQKIGNMLPPRWIFIAVENLQKGQEISSVAPMIIGMVAISVVTFLLSIFFTRNKIVLVKEDK
ncbi:MAG: ABC transporter permease, partial [Clostridiaceae bacterium]|nr:ABC transporter permease [Clostridiaceae bacterium]